MPITINGTGTIDGISSGGLNNGIITPAEMSTGAPSWDTSGNLSFNSGYGSVATAYGCRAWVNFNGTGTVAIRASGNVSSITDNGTGLYTVNLTNAMPDINYAACFSATDDNSAATYTYEAGTFGQFRTTNAIRFYVYGANAPRDAQGVYAAIFR